MDSQIYNSMMSMSPVVEQSYIAEILGVETIAISAIEIYGVVESNTSLTFRIKVNIEDENGKHSRKIFVKTVKNNASADVYRNLSLSEVKFYEFAQNLSIIDLPVVQCLDSFISEDRKFLLMMEDISDSYSVVDGKDLSQEDVWLSAACSLAQFHAAFWNSKLIGSNNLPIEDSEKIKQYISDSYECHDKFISHLQSRNSLNNETRDIYEHALKIIVSLHTERYNRLVKRDNVTIVHDDSHIYNFMFPNNKEGSLIDSIPKIIDFQFWGKGLALNDLAHLTRLSFPNKTLHKQVVAQYYKTLISHGVQGYTWENCWNDYRKHVATMLFIPVWQYTSFNLKYENWIDGVTSAIENYKALECENL